MTAAIDKSLCSSGHMFEVTLIIASLPGYPPWRFAIRRSRL